MGKRRPSWKFLRAWKTMWAVEESDLRLLIRTAKQLTVWFVPIQHRGQRWYQMEFEVADLNERGLLISARKNPHITLDLPKRLCGWSVADANEFKQIDA